MHLKKRVGAVPLTGCVSRLIAFPLFFCKRTHDYTTINFLHALPPSKNHFTSPFSFLFYINTNTCNINGRSIFISLEKQPIGNTDYEQIALLSQTLIFSQRISHTQDCMYPFITSGSSRSLLQFIPSDLNVDLSRFHPILI